MADEKPNPKDERPNETPKEKTQPTTTGEPTAPGKTAGPAKSNINDPAPYDWVTQRSACTLPKIFATLRAEVEKDVATRNSLRPNISPYEFSMTDDINAFTVLLKANELQRSVVFTLADHAIVVRNGQSNGRSSNEQSTQLFEITLAFDDAGHCRLHVDAQEREFWQVRRMALEDLMFRGL